ncbi:MAG: hypothetical protein B6I20_00785 [Bacteroidetes bacterium 4572_117]|nr:MAG: hypothetical protein B6I20_00785 [Bacteroidetes bacterium 4572_117]
MRLFNYIFFVLYTCGISFSAFGQDPIIFTNLQSSVSVGDKAVVYIDENASSTIKQVIELKRKNQFNSKNNDISIYSKSAIWFLFEIDNKKEEGIYLEIKPGFINEVSLFTIDDNKIIDSINLGSLLPAKNSELKINTAVFPISPGKYQYIMRIKTNTLASYSLCLLSKETLFKNEHLKNILNGLMFGALLLAFLYNLLLFIAVRDSVYAYYLALTLFAIFAFSYLSGIGYQLLWGQYLIISKHIVIVYSAIAISLILLVIKLFKISKNSIKTYRAFQSLIIIFLIICICDLFDFLYLSNILFIVFSAITYLALIVIVLGFVKKRDKSAILFIICLILSVGLFLLLVGVSLSSLFSTGNYFDYIIYSAFTNVALMSLVVGNKLNIYTHEKRKARTAELKALKESDNLITSQKHMLQKLVDGRNKEIINKNLELSNQQKEIENQINEIQQKNEELNAFNEQLQLKNKEIETLNVSLQDNKYELEKTVKYRTNELEKAKERAIVADNLKTSFLNNLSSELKIPMTAITGYSNMLQDKTITVLQRNDYLQIIMQNVDDLLSLIDNIVTFSRIQAQVIKLKTRELDLKAFITLIADEFTEKLVDLKKTNIHINTNMPDGDEKILIKSDSNNLWLIFKHLLDNSRKYTMEGGIELGFNIKQKLDKEIVSEKNIVTVQFFVKDSGEGMSKQEIEKYVTSWNIDINKYSHDRKGLGLAIVSGLTAIFNGKVSVDSEKGKGTTFFIEIDAELCDHV